MDADSLAGSVAWGRVGEHSSLADLRHRSAPQTGGPGRARPPPSGAFVAFSGFWFLSHTSFLNWPVHFILLSAKSNTLPNFQDIQSRTLYYGETRRARSTIVHDSAADTPLGLARRMQEPRQTQQGLFEFYRAARGILGGPAAASNRPVREGAPPLLRATMPGE